MTTMEFVNSTWPMFMGFITLVIVLAKMLGDIETIKEKVRVLFDLWNSKND